MTADSPGTIRDPRQEPLAARMRPRTLDEFVGQEHIVAPGRLLRRAIQADQLSSLIFFGPPGCGKTTLAAVIANTTQSRFVTLNAVLAGIKDLRGAVDAARAAMEHHGKRSILFVDEVHRWNKAQQDGLLPWVENGTVILIGATTENPFFSVNSPLLSRSRVFQLQPLTRLDLLAVAHAALADAERGYGGRRVRVAPDALDHIVDVAGGDARSVLNALELAVETTPPQRDGTVVVDMGVAEDSIQQRAVLYDRDGDVHYDTVSAFIKSLRGSDADAALYWLARMVYAGEDPRFLFRRMLILASEDVGLADPGALGVVVACAEAFDRVGLPEGRFHLAQAALYLATAPKSNSTLGFFDALKSVEQEGDAAVPAHLKDASRDRKGFGHGEGYLYPHAYRDHFVPQQYLPDPLQGKVFYQPSDQGRENTIARQVARRREAQVAAMSEGVAETPAEILSYSPADSGRERWLQRTIGRAGSELGRIRDRVVGEAGIQRHHIVLDLNGGSGLLTWEAVRRTPEGSVWVRAGDARSARGLRDQAAALPEPSRPVILEGALATLPGLVKARGLGAVRFDAVIGRNALAPLSDRPAALSAIARVLGPAARVSLAETIPRLGQRIHELMDPGPVPEALLNNWRRAEEALYENPDDPRIQVDTDSLAAAFTAAGLRPFAVHSEAHRTRLRVTPALLARWFPPPETEKTAARPSYRTHLLRCLPLKDVETIHTLLVRHLQGSEVEWSTTVAYITAAPAPPP